MDVFLIEDDDLLKNILLFGDMKSMLISKKNFIASLPIINTF